MDFALVILACVAVVLLFSRARRVAALEDELGISQAHRRSDLLQIDSLSDYRDKLLGKLREAHEQIDELKDCTGVWPGIDDLGANEFYGRGVPGPGGGIAFYPPIPVKLRADTLKVWQDAAGGWHYVLKKGK